MIDLRYYFDYLKKYKYGFLYGNKIYTNKDADFDSCIKRHWYLQSPLEFEKNKVGICYDYTHYIKLTLDGMKVDAISVFSYGGKNDSAHSFVLIPCRQGFLIPEYSWGNNVGTHYYMGTEESVILNYIHLLNKDTGGHQNKYKCFEDTNELTNMNINEYINYIFGE